MSPRKTKISEEEQKPLFFNSVSIKSLPVSGSLPLIKILNASYNKNKKKFSISFEIPGDKRLYNIFLFINGEKKDLFYQVFPGKHNFSFESSESENLAEIFYVFGSYRSEPAFSFLKKGEE